MKSSPAWSEMISALEAVELAEVERRRAERQARNAGRKAGIQDGLNCILRENLKARGWIPGVSVFTPDGDTGKGLWVMDFAKEFAGGNRISVGVEVTFNHAEALTWTPIRLTLAHEAEFVLPHARIDVGCIIIGTDDLKGNRKTGLRMDSAVGTYERLITVLPKMRSVLPAPLVIFGLDWADGGVTGEVIEMDLHTSKASGHVSMVT